MNHKLSETEQYLWNFIEHLILEIPNYSIVKLSEQANVSTATIVRTMKKKGYEGFTSFKHHLKEGENKNINFSFLDKVDKGIRRAILKMNKKWYVQSICWKSGTLKMQYKESNLLTGFLSLPEDFQK